MEERPQPVQPEPEPRVGKASGFLGTRLLLIALLLGGLGLAILVFSGIKLWLMVTRGHLGLDVIQVLVLGALAFALLSTAGSARRTGLRYLRGEKAVGRDMLRLVIRRIERRRTR